MPPLIRMTQFKIKDASSIPVLLEAYRVMSATAQKDGRPYILAKRAGPTKPDPRNAGYGFVGQTTFASADDMRYYDEECEAHKTLKATIKGHVEPPALVVCFEDELESV